MKRIVRLTESDLTRIIKRVIMEQPFNNTGPINYTEQDSDFEFDDLINKPGYGAKKGEIERVGGCTDQKAINYDKDAKVDDGSCMYREFKWYTNYNIGFSESKKNDLPVLLFFTGSDWCGWCKRLKSEIFDTDKFKDWAKDTVISVELDSPRDNRSAHDDIEKKYGIDGFPTVLILTPDGTVIGKTGYYGSDIDSWINKVNEIIQRNTPY
jgi:thiol-disulfide isomerase/thioredoxin